MIRKYSRMLFLAMLSFFIAMPFSKALEVDIDTIGETIDEVSPVSQSVYVIGEYIFTEDHILTTQDIMLAAKSIHLKDTVGKTKDDDVFDEMTVFILSRDYDSKYNPTGTWSVEKENYIGSSEFPETLTIRYVDYHKVLNKYKITLRYNDGATSNGTLVATEGIAPTEPTKPEREGYVFDGWYLDGELFEFDEPIEEDITLDAHWKNAVDFEELLDLGTMVLDNEEFGATFENDVFSIQVKNKYRKIEDTDLNGLVMLIDDLLKNDRITSVVLNYNDTEYKITTATPEDERKSTIESLLDALASTGPAKVNLFRTMSVNPDARFSSTLEKVFTISVTLKDDAALTENSKTLYSVKFVSNATDAEVETNLTDGFKGETSEFAVTVQANDYANEKMHLSISLPEGSYENLQYCETSDSCAEWTGEEELTLKDKTYNFRVTWKTEGKTDYTISIVDAKDETITYATTTGSVTNKEKFDVTFEYEDDTTPNKTVKVVSGELVEEPEEPTREHYDFVGWFHEEQEYTFEEPVTGNLNLKAKWEGKTYTATFSGEGVDASNYPAQTVTYPEKVTKPETEPTWAEHEFSGWFVDGVEFNFNDPLTEDVTIEAKWDIVKYEVEFFGEENLSIKKENVESGSLVQAPDLSKKGYKLSWHKDSQDGELYNLQQPVTGALKLYAKFEPIKYTFEYNGEGITEPSQEYTYPNLPTQPTNPEREGYTFLGWYLGNADQEYDFDTEILEEGTITLTGKWKANVYHVTYKCEGCDGSMPVNQDFTYPNKPAEPTIKPTKSGYDFLYWYDESDEKQTKYDFSTKLLKDLTLVAKFDTHKYEIKFQACSETDKACKADTIDGIPETLRVGFNEFAVKPSVDPTREGYDFLGWYNIYPTVSDTPFNFEGTKITKGYTLMAKWKKKTYTVTFKTGEEDVLKTVSDVEYGTTVEDRLKAADMQDFVLSPYKEGYRFDHWYLATGEESQTYDFKTPVKEDIVLMAKFVPVVNIDNLVGDAALKIQTDHFLTSFANKTITVNVDDGDGDHATAHNDEKLTDLTKNSDIGVSKAIKGIIDHENVASVKMSYAGVDYSFTGTEVEITTELIKLLTAIATKNNSTYEEATLNELIENNYNENPITLTITLDEDSETVDNQAKEATYNVKVVSDVITVTNEGELKTALNGTYKSIKIGKSFELSDTIYISRTVSIFGKANTITMKNETADAIFDIRHNNVGGGTTVNIKDITLEGGKKGIRVPEKTTVVYITDVTFKDNTEMAMEIYGKLHAAGNLSYNKEDYNHPFVRTPRSNAVTGTSTVKETENIQVHDAYLDYEYEIIHKYADRKYTDEDFKARTWEAGKETIQDIYCEECIELTGELKAEYQAKIGQDYINHSDSAEKTSWAHYYLDKNHSQYYVVVFKDTPSAAIIWRYVLYGEEAVMPEEPLPTAYFKSFARTRSVKVRNEDGSLSEQPATFELKGWSDNSKGTTENYPLENIKDVKESRYYYTYYQKVDE